MNFKKFLDDDVLTDVTLTLVDGKRDIVYKFHKLILYASSEYFQKIFLGDFKEKNLDTLLMNVPNAYVCYDVIRSFYGDKTNLGGLPDWKHSLEYIKCCDFLGIELNLVKYTHLIVPIEGIPLLLKIANLTNYANAVLKIMAENIPEDYKLDNKL